METVKTLFANWYFFWMMALFLSGVGLYQGTKRWYSVALLLMQTKASLTEKQKAVLYKRRHRASDLSFFSFVVMFVSVASLLYLVMSGLK